MIVTVYVDRKESWYTPHAADLVVALCRAGHIATLAHTSGDIQTGDVCFLLSCVKIAGPKLLGKNKLNLVVHASDLPLGKGFSPLAYQIAQGKNTIPLTMIEAVEAVDAGDIYMQRFVYYYGHELLDELRIGMAAKIAEMVLDYSAQPYQFLPRAQIGEGSWYPRRTVADDELDPELSVVAQFNKLRVVDNQSYPAWFKHAGHEYAIKIEKKK